MSESPDECLISILICVIKKPPPPPKEKGASAGSVKKEVKKKKKAKKGKYVAVVREEPTLPQPDEKPPLDTTAPEPEVLVDPHSITVGPPEAYVHINYVLIPNRPACHVDVVVWHHAAKIFPHKEHPIVVRTILRKEYIFVAFSLRHLFHLEPRDILDFSKWTITFNATADKAKVGSEAQNNTSTAFAREENADLDDTTFCLLGDVSNTKARKRDSVQNGDLNPSGLIATHVVDKVHKSKILELIDRSAEKDFCLRSPLEMDVEEYLKIINAGDTIDLNRFCEETDVDGKVSPSANVRFHGDYILGDSRRCMSKFSPSTSAAMPHFSVTLTARAMFPKRLLDELRIFTVAAHRVKNVPVEDIRKGGFDAIYTRTKFLGVQHDSLVKPLDKEIEVLSGKVLVGNDFHNAALQTSLCIVEVHGLRPLQTRATTAKIFGEESTDNLISTPLHCALMQKLKRYKEPGESDVILAVARFSLAVLLHKSFKLTVGRVDLEEECLLPGDVMSGRALGSRVYSTNEVNSVRIRSHPEGGSPLSQGRLLENSMTVKLTAQINGIGPSASTAQTYSRMFCVVKDPGLAESLLRSILEHNRDSSTSAAEDEDGGIFDGVDSTTSSACPLTGFAVDNAAYMIFFAEGPTHGYIMTIWSHLMGCDSHAIRTNFDSSLTFAERLYADVEDHPCFLTMRFKYRIEVMLTCPRIYIPGFMPDPARKGLLKLERLLNASNMMKMSQQNLFPTSQELRSLRLECCTPSRKMDEGSAVSQSVQ